MKQILDLTLTENSALNATNALLKFHAPSLPPMKPGQFVEVRVDNAPNTYLRRPISVNWVDEAKNELWLLVQVVGEGTEKLAQLQVGSVVNMLLPLGNGFSLPKNPANRVLLVGGGVGTAPLLYMGELLKRNGFIPTFLLGARSADGLLQTDHFKQIGNLYVTTEDGTAGEKGYVTQHSILTSQTFDNIYTCGPKPMMEAVVAFARKNNIWCEASLENTMACGFGVCLCCVEETIHGNQCVCTEGPVFNSSELKW